MAAFKEPNQGDAAGGRQRSAGASGRRAGESLGKLFDRLPPHSLEAEMSLLGSMILDPAVVPDVLSLVKSGEEFYSDAHSAIYEAAVALYDRHQSGDVVQLVEALRDKRVLEDIGGADYLVRLAESVPSAVNAPHYARIVTEKSKLRRLIFAAGEILHNAYHTEDIGPEGAREVLDKAERLIFDVAEESQSGDPERLKELLEETLRLLEANQGRTISGIASGYYKLDEMTSGLQPGEMVILAARPSMGKTALALNLAENIAFSGGPGGGAAPVAVFSLEMSRQSVAQRILCATAQVDSQRLRRNMLNMEEHKLLAQAVEELKEAPIFIDDTPGMSVLQLRARARRMAAQHGVRCIIIDYLQLLTAPGSARESRQVEVSAISRGIKSLARELKVPVICLSQLNRGAENREGNKPRMSDLRESGSIEQDADVVILLHREEYYHQADPEWSEQNPDKVGLADLIIAKQRNGPTGLVELLWDAKTTRFKNHAGRGYAARSEGVVETRATVEAYSPASAPQPFDQRAFEPKPYAPGRKTGPIESHRDGGGPERGWEPDDRDLPPF